MIRSLPFLASILASSPASPVSRTQVVVDASGLRQAGVDQLDSTIETTRTMVDLNLREELKTQGVALVDDADAPRIEVALFWKDYRASHFSIAIEVVRDDGTRVPLPRFDCKHCGNNDLLDRINAEIPTVLERLAPPPEPPPPPAVAAPTPPPPPLPAPLVDESPPLGSKGKAGIACLALGGAAVIVGSVFVGLGRQPVNDDHPGGGEVARGIDYQPPGIAVLSVGGTAVITGAILLALDRGYARGRVSHRASPTGRSWTVLATPKLLGATFTSRF